MRRCLLAGPKLRSPGGDKEVNYRTASANLTAVLVCGCGAHLSSSAERTAPEYTYEKALHVCRFWHSGKPARRFQLPATEDHVAACLGRLGWEPGAVPVKTEPPKGSNL